MRQENAENPLTPLTGNDIVAGVVHGITPVALKSLSRLIGAGLDYPAAWVERLTEEVRTKTASRKIVEGAVAKSVAKAVVTDDGLIARASESLLRREYRQQENREAVAVGAAKLLIDHKEGAPSKRASDERGPVDEDWLNIFERYVEDASTERMRGVWSRVLSGEIKNPGSYSRRTLRCLSDMSQADALQFAECARFAVSNFVPKSLILNDTSDITPYLNLEASGLIGGISSGLQQYFNPDDGILMFADGDYLLIFSIEEGANVTFSSVVLSPIGVELLSILPDRDVVQSMREVAKSIRQSSLTSASIHTITSRQGNNIKHSLAETLW